MARPTAAEKSTAIRIELAKANVVKITRKRKRIAKAIKALEAETGMDEDVKAETVKLLRLYARRIGKLREKNQKVVDDE
jgi:hypothetical protein